MMSFSTSMLYKDKPLFIAYRRQSSNVRASTTEELSQASGCSTSDSKSRIVCSTKRRKTVVGVGTVWIEVCSSYTSWVGIDGEIGVVYGEMRDTIRSGSCWWFALRA